MVFSLYGLDLIVLREEHMEMVRQGRNSEQVRRYMHFQDEITPAMQKKWFASINNINNLYFLIKYQDETPGIVFAKDIDYEKSRAEAGILIWDTKYHDSHVAGAAILSCNDIVFNLYQLQTVYFHLYKFNDRANRNHNRLGSIVQYQITDHTWLAEGKAKTEKTKRQQKLKRAMRIVMECDDQVQVQLEPDHDTKELIQHVNDLYKTMKPDEQTRYSLKS